MIWLIALVLALMALAAFLLMSRINERRYEPDNRAETIIGFNTMHKNWPDPTMSELQGELLEMVERKHNMRSSD